MWLLPHRLRHNKKGRLLPSFFAMAKSPGVHPRDMWDTYLVLHANGDITLLFYLALPVRSL